MSENGRRPGKAARNEQRKAFATTLNAVSVAFLVAALVQPIVSGRVHVGAVLLTVAAVLGLQLGLHYVLSKIED